MTQKMKMAALIAGNKSLNIYEVASADGDFCTRGGARVWDLAREYMDRKHAKWAYEYRNKHWHFRQGFREFCGKWYYEQLKRLAKERVA